MCSVCAYGRNWITCYRTWGGAGVRPQTKHLLWKYYHSHTNTCIRANCAACNVCIIWIDIQIMYYMCLCIAWAWFHCVCVCVMAMPKYLHSRPHVGSAARAHCNGNHKLCCVVQYVIVFAKWNWKYYRPLSFPCDTQNCAHHVTNCCDSFCGFFCVCLIAKVRRFKCH